MKNTLLNKIRHSRIATLVFIALISIVVLTIAKPGTFLTTSNFSGIFTTMSFDLLISCGMTIVLILGGVDLSVGSVVAFGSIICATLSRNGVSIVLAILITLISGALIGVINGMLITKFSLAPYVATLGMQQIIRGICYVTTSGYLISGLPAALTNISRLTIGFIPSLVIISLVVSIFVGIILRKLNLFKQMYLVGTNPEAAKLSGMPADKLKIIGYGLSGLFAGLSGILIAGRYGMGTATYGIGFESKAIAAAVIGGAVMSGGEGDMFGTMLGVMIVAVVNNAFIQFGGPAEWQYAVSGIMLVLALYIDHLKIKSTQRKEA